MRVSTPRAPNYWGDAENSQQCRKYFLQYSTFSPERPYVRTRGAKLVSCRKRDLFSVAPPKEYQEPWSACDHYRQDKFSRFLRRFRDPIRVPRISNRVPRIRENYHRVPKIREIGSLQIHTGYLTFSLKKT